MDFGKPIITLSTVFCVASHFVKEAGIRCLSFVIALLLSHGLASAASEPACKPLTSGVSCSDQSRMAVFDQSGDLVSLKVHRPAVYSFDVFDKGIKLADSNNILDPARITGVRLGFIQSSALALDTVSSSIEGNQIRFLLEDRKADSLSFGLKVSKIYTFRDQDLQFDLKLENPSSRALSLYPSSNPLKTLGLVFGCVMPRSMYATFTAGKGVEQTTIGSTDKFTPVAETAWDLLAYRNQYFVLGLHKPLAADFFLASQHRAMFLTGLPPEADLFTSLHPLSKESLAPSEVLSASYNFYFGEKVEDKMAKTPFFALFDKYGAILGGIEKFLFWLLTIFYGWCGNYGVAILLLTLIVKVILFPLNRKQVKSMAKLQKLQPELKRIQEMYKDDRQRLSQEMMALYKEHNVNPLGGCLPILAQMPVFIALFYTVGGSVEMMGVPFLWVHDLSKEDPTLLLPLLFVGSFIISQSKMTLDPSQKMLIYLMPAMLFLIMMHMPSGVMIYIVGQALMGNLETWMISTFSKDTQVPAMEVVKPTSGKKKKR